MPNTNLEDNPDKKVLLVNPPYERLMGFKLESMTLGLIYLATVLDKEGFKANVYDADTTSSDDQIFKAAGDEVPCQTGNHLDVPDGYRSDRVFQDTYASNIDDINHPAWQEFIGVINDYKPKVVGITVKTPHYHSSLKAAEIIKNISSDIVVVAGGPHITITSDNMLDSKYIDYSFNGESEVSFLEFIKKLFSKENVNDVSNLSYRENGRVLTNPNAERIKDLDELPYPNKDLLLFRERYTKKLGAMITSRGCPYDCTFCSIVPQWGRKTGFRSAKSIVGEMLYLNKKYGVKNYEILDDIFTIRKKLVLEVCDEIVKTFGEQKITWPCLAYLTTLDDEILKALKKAGCNRINVGVESGSDKILKMINKKANTKQIMETVKLVKKNGIWAHGYFMFGLPQETEEDMLKTIDFMDKLPLDSVHLTTYTPYPNTVDYDYAVSNGIIEEDNSFDRYKYVNTHSKDNYFVKGITKERFSELLVLALATAERKNQKLTYKKLGGVIKRNVKKYIPLPILKLVRPDRSGIGLYR